MGNRIGRSQGTSLSDSFRWLMIRFSSSALKYRIGSSPLLPSADNPADQALLDLEIIKWARPDSRGEEDELRK
jgi:hypothetical protein